MKTWLVIVAVLVLLVIILIWTETNPLNTLLVWHAKHRGPYLPLNDEFPEHELILRYWHDIQREALAVYQDNDLTDATDASSQAFKKLNKDKKWQVFMLTFYGKKWEDNLKKCPVTAWVISQIPRIKYAMFSILAPRSHIPPHKGPFRGCSRYHCGLKVPKARENCFISVDNQKYHWKEREGVLLDDTFTHFVRNDTDETRIILFCDIQRNLTGRMGRLNTWICNSSIPRWYFESNKKNEKIESTMD